MSMDGKRATTSASASPRPVRPEAGTPEPPRQQWHGSHSDEAPVYVISVAAELAGMHPQTLRTYDRLGLVQPGRTAGRGRRYSPRDVSLLREVQRLSQEEGVNLEGIRRILGLGRQVAALQARVRELEAEVEQARREADARVEQAHQSHRRDLVPVDRSAVVVWRRQR
jgi:MerR family transcriptional regulator, heat shock protein HspR